MQCALAALARLTYFGLMWAEPSLRGLYHRMEPKGTNGSQKCHIMLPNHEGHETKRPHNYLNKPPWMAHLALGICNVHAGVLQAWTREPAAAELPTVPFLMQDECSGVR